MYFVDYYSHYLMGVRFLVNTDHGSLRWLMNVKEAEGQLARWMAHLSKFDFNIKHRPCDGECKQCSKVEEPRLGVLQGELVDTVMGSNVSEPQDMVIYLNKATITTSQSNNKKKEGTIDQEMHQVNPQGRCHQEK